MYFKIILDGKLPKFICNNGDIHDTFLKDGYEMSIYTEELTSWPEKILIKSATGSRFRIKGVEDMLEFVDITTMEKFYNFVLFALYHEWFFLARIAESNPDKNILFDDGMDMADLDAMDLTEELEAIDGFPHYLFVRDVCSAREQVELQKQYNLQPQEVRKLGNNHYQFFADCFCNSNGKLARVCFSLQNNVFTVSEVAVYAETSLMKYFQCHDNDLFDR